MICQMPSQTKQFHVVWKVISTVGVDNSPTFAYVAVSIISFTYSLKLRSLNSLYTRPAISARTDNLQQVCFTQGYILRKA